MRRSQDLEIEIEDAGDAKILRPIGDIDLSRAPSLRTQLGAVQSSRPLRLIIDLSRVPYMDSSGVATLVEAMQVTRRTNSRLVLCAMQEKVRSVFEIARLDMVFTIVSTTDDAMIA